MSIDYLVTPNTNVDEIQLEKIKAKFGGRIQIEEQLLDGQDEDIYLVEFRWVDIKQIREIEAFMLDLYK